MSSVLMGVVVRTWFSLTSRDKASMKIRKSLDKYLDLARRMSAETGTLRIFVPKMPGIDEDMRNWSFFMLLIHYRQAGYVVRKIEKTDHAL